MSHSKKRALRRWVLGALIFAVLMLAIVGAGVEARSQISRYGNLLELQKQEALLMRVIEKVYRRWRPLRLCFRFVITKRGLSLDSLFAARTTSAL